MRRITMIRRWGQTCAFAALLVATSNTFATVGPPVKVVVPSERMVPAVSGQEYSGAVEVQARAVGWLDDVSLSGVGWVVTLHTGLKPIEMPAGTSYLVEYTAVAADASNPLMFRATFNGREVLRRIDVGQEFFASAGKAGRVSSVNERGELIRFTPMFNNTPPNTSGQMLRFRGRIAYNRPATVDGGGPAETVGADNVYYEIVDDDDISTEVIHGGLTDVNGDFDVTVAWDDCDIAGCDAPDIYLRWELDNGVLDVRLASILPVLFQWSTEDETIDDFEGNEVDFGLVMPANPAHHSPMHIHNTITRAFRFIQLQTGLAVEKVRVLWPASGTTSFFDGDVNITANRSWNEGTMIHEYGHHILDTYAENVTPDYCNGYCDGADVCFSGDDCPNEGHCLWCPETDHDAWNEGFPNWLASVIMSKFPAEYGSNALAITDSRFMLESTSSCCDGTMAARFTEGFIAALLNDIADGNNDDHSGGSYDCLSWAGNQDCIVDAMTLGVKEIFDIALNEDATTPDEFIQRFRAKYPQYDQDLWSTANNVSPDYSFPVPTPEVRTQTQVCKVNMAGDPLTIEAVGNGSVLRYQWQRFNQNVVDTADTSGANCPHLTFDPLTPAHAGVYRATITTCDQSSSTVSLPIRVSVLPARGDGEGGVSWGRNNGGQLGRGVYDITGANTASSFPAPMVELSDAVSISPGPESWHKVAVKFNGDVWGWGYNDNGQLGTDPATVYFTHTPFRVPNVENIVLAASGQTFSMALRADGKVYSWGDNDYGSRGDGTFYGYNPQPYLIENLECVVSIAAGGYHAAAVKSDGTVWTWGNGYYGQLGYAPVGFLYNSVPAPQEVPGISNAIAVATGGYHTLVLRQDGTVLAFGRNDEGQLGDGTRNSRSTPMTVPGLTNVSAVRAGTFNSFVILQDGTVRGWGSNGGTLGDGSANQSLTPVQPLDVGTVLDVAGGYYHTIFLRTDRTVWATGWNVYGELGPRPNPEPLRPLPIAGISNALAIGAGSGTSFAISAGVGPYIWQQPQNRSVLAGKSASFSVEHFGTPEYTYQWRRDGVPLANGNGISGVNTPTLALNPVVVAHLGNYTVLVQNSFGQAVSQAAALTLVCANGDGNCDGRIDNGDAASLAQCLAGPGAARPAICAVAAFGYFDANNDNDVDLGDAAVIQNCFAGEEFIDPACAP